MTRASARTDHEAEQRRWDAVTLEFDLVIDELHEMLRDDDPNSEKKDKGDRG